MICSTFFLNKNVVTKIKTVTEYPTKHKPKLK